MDSLPGPDDTLRTVLPNGIKVLVRENPASPSVVVRGYVEAGAEDELHGRQGLAGFTVDVMQRGTTARAFGALYEEVEAIGASFGLRTGAHTTSFGGKCLGEDLEALLQTLCEVLQHPSFDAHQVERARTEILTAIQEREQSTGRMAGLRFYELAYPSEHPYHWSQLGYPETIPPLTRDDLVAFHTTYFASEQAVVVVVGGVGAQIAVSAVEEAFGGWQGRRPDRKALVPVAAPSAINQRYAGIEQKEQVSVMLGWPGPHRRHPDYLPCLLGNAVLGQFGLQGRLGRTIREEHGLAYYVYSKLSGGSGPGPWRVVGGFDPENVDRGVQLMLDELRRFTENGVKVDELVDVASHMTGSLPLQLETNGGVARSLAAVERYGLGLDYIRKYPSLIRSITPEDVLQAVRRWINTERYVLSMAGPPREAN